MEMETGSSSASAKNAEANEASVTMLDVLKDQEDLEDEMNAVLGGSDENNCTYSKGYIPRQALYSCLTCIPESKVDPTKRTGVCLACSYKCHENHDLVELYTKRNFRCDCGSSKMLTKKCMLDPFKEENILNEYNQNFSGLYCTCHRPYPDPEDDVSDEMIQCIMCEDWYHTRHLDTAVPKAHEYSEMVCGGCMSNFEFLKYYIGNISDSNAAVVNEDVDLNESTSATSTLETKQEAEGKHKLDDANEENKEVLSKKIKLDICTKPSEGVPYEKGATFWIEAWRKSLCKCLECSEMYSRLKIEYLLKEEDTVQWYEQHGKLVARESDYDRGMRALSSLGRVQQVDAITEYNRMKDRLKEYLNTFVVNQQVVTEDDIKQFFTTFKNEKSGAPVVPPNFCR